MEGTGWPCGVTVARPASRGRGLARGVVLVAPLAVFAFAVVVLGPSGNTDELAALAPSATVRVVAADEVQPAADELLGPGHPIAGWIRCVTRWTTRSMSTAGRT